MYEINLNLKFHRGEGDSEKSNPWSGNEGSLKNGTEKINIGP